MIESMNTVCGSVDPEFEELKKERRPIPKYEGFYSIRGDGTVFSDERIVTKSDGKRMKVKERALKEVPHAGGNGYVGDSVSFKFSVDGERASFSKSSLLKMVFPELFKPVENLQGEEWRAVEAHPRYMVSNKGRIKRVKEINTVNGMEYVNQEELRHIGNMDGYALVSLQGNDENNACLLGRLIYETFVRKLSKEEHIQYKDGNAFNLCLENLEALHFDEYREKDKEGRYKPKS
jgi:hypothetical protein